MTVGLADAQRIQVKKEVLVNDLAWLINWGPKEVFFLVRATDAKTGKILKERFLVGTVAAHQRSSLLLVRMPPSGIVWWVIQIGAAPRLFYSSAVHPMVRLPIIYTRFTHYR